MLRELWRKARARVSLAYHLDLKIRRWEFLKVSAIAAINAGFHVYSAVRNCSAWKILKAEKRKFICQPTRLRARDNVYIVSADKMFFDDRDTMGSTCRDRGI